MSKTQKYSKQRAGQAEAFRGAAAGKNGASLAPPAYGIDIIDRSTPVNQPADSRVASLPAQTTRATSRASALGGKGDPSLHQLLAGHDHARTSWSDTPKESRREAKRHRLRPVVSLVKHGHGAEAKQESDHGDNTLQAGVGTKAVAGPTTGDNGIYSWTIQWVLDGASAKGGWIIQKIDMSFTIADEHGKAVDVSKKGFDASKVPYWEAWKINAGKKITTYAETGDTADDTYASGTNWGAKTKGTIKVTGSAQFYEDLTLPADFKPTHPYAGILPATTKDPGALAGGTGSIAHNLTATWDSTAGDKKTTLVTVP